MRAVLALARKDLLLLVRDRIGFFFVFFFPLLYAVFFGYIGAALGGDDEGMGAIPIVLVDEDRTDGSRALVERLVAADEVAVLVLEDREEAAALVRRGKRSAYVVLPAGYGEAAAAMLGGGPPSVDLGVDPSRKVESGILSGILAKHAARRFEAAARALGADAEGAMVPVDIRRAEVTTTDDGVPFGPWSLSFPQGIVWALMGAAAGFGISLVVERTRGTLVRLQLAPIRSAHILAGKATACFLTAVGVTTVLLILGILAFEVRPHSYGLLAMAVLCVAGCFVGIMMLLSVLGRTEAAAGGIGWAVLCMMAMIGGGMIPYVFLAKVPFLATLSHVSPIKWSILALEGAVWRGFTVAEMALPCGILLAVGVAGFAAGAAIFRRLG
jgi:ABC-2 type transport system permease protein